MKGSGKFCWWWLVLVLMTLLLPQVALAQKETTDLAMTLVSGNYYNRVTAGKDNTFFLELRNTGSTALTNIRLSADKPEGWVVEFSPTQIGYLAAGSLQTVEVNVRPDSKASKTDYQITLIAEANEIRKVSPIWVTVQSTSFWLWVGGG